VDGVAQDVSTNSTICQAAANQDGGESNNSNETESNDAESNNSQPYWNYHHYECSTRAQCVDDLSLDIADFISFQCECVDNHYAEYIKTGGEWPAETSQMCKDFIQCLQSKHDMRERIMVSIARAIGRQDSSGVGEQSSNGTTGAALGQENSSEVGQESGNTTAAAAAAVGQLRRRRRRKREEAASASENCFEPSNLTYVALVECRCLKDLVDTCGNVLVEDTVGCLFKHACQHQDVCTDWKAVNCHYRASQMHSGSQEHALLRQLFPTHEEATWASERKELEAVQKELSVVLKELDVERRENAILREYTAGKEIQAARKELSVVDEDLDVESREFEALRKRSISGDPNSLVSVDEHIQLESTLQSKCA
jgi:hypothetical protein